MAISVTQLFASATLGTSVATLYTCPATPTSNVLVNGRVRFTNVDTVARTVTAYAPIPSAGSAGDANTIVLAKSIAAADYIDIDLPQMKAGDFFQAKCDSANKVTCSPISGVVSS